MLAFRSWLRCGAALLLTFVLAGLGSACSHKTSSDSFKVSGSVLYSRVPVTYDANGSPTGLGTAVPNQVARGVQVRAFQLYDVVGQDGTTVPTWRLAGTAITDDSGRYDIGSLLDGHQTFLEVTSIFKQVTGNGASVRLIADPNGIRSTLAENRRPIYLYRVDLNNHSFTDPTSNPHGITVGSGDLSMNIVLTASETWAVSLDEWYLPGNVSGSANPAIGSAAQPPSDTLPLGSRALGILDSVWYFSYYYGDPTPSRVKGGVMDLHYWPGGSASGAPAITESPRRAFVVYDTATITPQAYDGVRLHYFATLAGGPAVDDAWDPGVLYPMLARNNLWGQNRTSLYPAGTSTLPSEAPDLAVVDGMGDAMAATLLKTPFLTDSTASTALAPRDIRTIPAIAGYASPQALGAFAWKVTVLANGMSDGVGTPTRWAGIDPVAAQRFFVLTYPTVATTTTSSRAVRSDINSVYAQMTRLQESKASSEPVDLSAIFYDLAMYLAAQPYGITWTNSAAAPALSDRWGLNPVSQAFPSFTLSMANAATVPNPDLRVTDPTYANVYPNVSLGAVHEATLSLNLDTSYILSVSTDQALPAGAAIEVTIDGAVETPYLFGSGNPSITYPITLKGNPNDFVNPIWHYLRIRLVAPADPSAPVVPDLAVTVRLDRATS